MKKISPYSRAARLAATGSLLTAMVLGTVGCNGTTPNASPAGTAGATGAASGTNDKRWSAFQETNKRDMGTANAAFEKRQAQLAEKRRKGQAAPASGAKTP